MEVVYYCSCCNRLIDRLEIRDDDLINEQKLGFSILTPAEKEDIINRTEERIEVQITCDECAEQNDLISLLNKNLIH
ncbi:MAG: anti-sigma-F factor Fin [Bacillota bacterium]